MTTTQKSIHEPLSQIQVIARVSRQGRGKQIMDRIAVIPPPSEGEKIELERELGDLMTAERNRDTAAALARGDFHREPPARPAFTAAEESVFGKSLNKALGSIK